jgi:Putative zinc-finger
MQHLDEGTIHSWLDGALSPEEAARVEAHVKECPQCEAAVAEARGFIAGSSRILTALDDAPRGVIPAVASKRRVDPMVWRVAATVMIVAAGTLVVVRSRGGDERPMSAVEAGSGKREAGSGKTEEGAAVASAPATIAVDTVSPLREAGRGKREEGSGGIGLSKKAGPSPSRPNVAVRDNAALPEVTSERADRRGALSPAASAPAVVGAPAPAPVARMGALSLNRAMMDAAADSQPLRIVGTPRRIGAKVTLYEVAPGDTVTLTESLTTTLQSVVMTGAGTTRAQGAGKAVAAPSRTRNAAPTVTPADSQSEVRVQAALPTVSPAPAAQLSAVSGFNAIVWSDPATGSTLTLAGRMPEARLKEIKIRIERERAAAAAAPRKSP